MEGKRMTDEIETALGPTPERLRMAAEDWEQFVSESGRRTFRLLDGSTLDNLLSRKVITADQYHAGGQFYRDWYLSGLAASGVIDPSRDIVDNSPNPSVSERKLDAMQKWQAAVQYIGLIHCQVLTSVVLMEETLESYGRRRYKVTNAKKARLKAITSLIDALDSLDVYYYGRKSVRMASAHAPDYRPRMNAVDR
jgi:hypothetical protein